MRSQTKKQRLPLPVKREGEEEVEEEEKAEKQQQEGETKTTKRARSMAAAIVMSSSSSTMMASTSTATAATAATTTTAMILRRRRSSPRPPPTPAPSTAATTTRAILNPSPSPSPTPNSPALPTPPPPPFLRADRLGARPLRCVFTGTNPSCAAWRAGHAYAHGSNRFWPLVHSSPGIVPAEVSLVDPLSSAAASASLSALQKHSKSSSSKSTSPFRGDATDDALLPLHAGVGICDVGGFHAETDLSSIASSQFERWAPCYYSRLVSHVERASAAVGCRCCCSSLSSSSTAASAASASASASAPSRSDQQQPRHPSTCCAPVVIAFTGKRQFVELLNASPPPPPVEEERPPSSSSPPSTSASASAASKDGSKKTKKKKRFDASMIDYGPQPSWLRPRDWPRCLARTELWVLTTTSGAAGLTNEARAAPYVALGRRLGREPWPRPLPACCCVVKK